MPNLRKRKAAVSYIDTPDRREICEKVKKVKERQAIKMNKHRENMGEEDRNEVIKVDDIVSNFWKEM
jgi:hypothetical protein